MGVQRLADFTGVASCEGGTGHAPGDRTRNPCAPFLAIFHLYTPENPSTPRLSLYSHSPPPSLRPARRPGYAQGRRRGREPSVYRACTAHLSISFYYCTESTAAINPCTPDALKSKLQSERSRYAPLLTLSFFLSLSLFNIIHVMHALPAIV